MPALAPVLLLLALAMPLLEIGVLIKVSSLIGGWLVLLIVIGTGMLGMAILRSQGFAFLRLMRETMRTGRPPLEPVIETGLRGLAGGFLLLPGLIGDMIGLLLLVPWLRAALARLLHDRILPRGPAAQPFPGNPFPNEPSPHERAPDAQDAGAARAPRPRPLGPTVIEGEFKRLDEH